MKNVRVLLLLAQLKRRHLRSSRPHIRRRRRRGATCPVSSLGVPLRRGISRRHVDQTCETARTSQRGAWVGGRRKGDRVAPQPGSPLGQAGSRPPVPRTPVPALPLGLDSFPNPSPAACSSASGSTVVHVAVTLGLVALSTSPMPNGLTTEASPASPQMRYSPQPWAWTVRQFRGSSAEGRLCPARLIRSRDKTAGA